jgi:hypothetical protein
MTMVNEMRGTCVEGGNDIHDTQDTPDEASAHALVSVQGLRSSMAPVF